MRIISFIDQPEVIKKIRQDLGRREEFHASPRGDPPVKEITFDLSYSLGQWLIRLRWKLIQKPPNPNLGPMSTPA